MATEVLTGRSGNIGRYFPKEFIALTTRLERPRAEMEEELKRLPRPVTRFVHLAGITTHQECEADPERAFQINVVGATRWFEAAANAQVRHFVFTSTSHAYGRPLLREPLSPTEPLHPTTIYGHQKAEAEQALRELSLKYPETKLTVARLFTILSPAMRPGFLFTNLHKRARAKDFSPIHGLSYVRDFMPMERAVNQLVALVRWDQAPPVLNICSGRPTTVYELARQVYAEYGLSTEGIAEGPAYDDDIDYLVGQPDERFLNYLDKT